MNLVLFDDPVIRLDLLPFTYTRPVAELRVGILTLRQKWENYLGLPASYLTQDYLATKYPITHSTDNLLINGALCPDSYLLAAVKKLAPGQSLVKGDRLLAIRGESPSLDSSKTWEYPEEVTIVDQPWKIFQLNGAQIRSDASMLAHGRRSAEVGDPHTKVYAWENIFIEEGAVVKACVLNATQGPIYLGKNSQVQEGALIRGPFALGEGSIVNMGAKIKGDTTVGPQCKVGGEISNSVIFGYSNKAHDGFLGSSVIGEWCNLGADTNTSNLKNNYDSVKLWNYRKGGFQSTGLTFCGLMMGDHTKCGINTMFNTGTVTGICSNIFGDGYPRNFIPSFSWGGAAGFTTFQLDKAHETAARAMERRKTVLEDIDKKILAHVFSVTKKERVWEAKS